MRKGKLYEFWPVLIDDDNSNQAYSVEGAWQWRYFGWLAPIFCYVFAFLLGLLGYEPGFCVKLEKEEGNGKEAVSTD